MNAFRQSIILVASLSVACAANDLDEPDASTSSVEGGSAGASPDAAAPGPGGSGGTTTSPGGGAAGSAGAAPLRDDECVESEEEPGWCLPTRDAPGWDCCTVSGTEYDSGRGCKLGGPHRILTCFAKADFCEYLASESCVKGDEGVFFTPSYWGGYRAELAAAGLSPCSEQEENELVFDPPTCEEPEE